MPIVKPFMNSLRFSSTAGAGTGTGATYNILATAFTTDGGTAATVFQLLLLIIIFILTGKFKQVILQQLLLVLLPFLMETPLHLLLLLWLSLL